MQRAATEFQSLPARGAFSASAFVRPAADRQFVPLTPGRGAFTSGVPLGAQRAQGEPAPVTQVNAETATFGTEPARLQTPSTGPELELSARVAELEQALQEQAARHDEALRLAAAEHAAAVAVAAEHAERANVNSRRLGALIAELGRLREGLVAELRAEAGDVLLVGARRLAGQALQEQPGVLEALVEECVDALGSGALVIRVNPEDVERVQAVVSEGVRVVPDASVGAGCVVEGDGTRVAATVAGGVGSLADELAAWRRSG
jgi:flagellar biosynthesis/type III secretory pathway protein FliH